ncbi:hypothetical protein AK88_00617 [Plasmodium fragile]|uniref:Uncharacterized protein n=1 Tax=Plasmodium fragile TaxID=5857 RepID=A0A0D9QRI2_PLAFR|nr:uncharacterized protein AK88_00617 [Plasmodium fragile]KJP89659.1 hypothetical protein AK88_00617 [Plasmodium fragile]
MESKKKGNKLLYCALGVLVPAYWFHHRRTSKSKSNNNHIINQVEMVKKLKMNNALCHIPLIILTIYDNYIYENKMLRKIYYTLRERPFYKMSVPSSTLLHNRAHKGKNNTNKTEGTTHHPDYKFIMNSEKNIFNKLYVYELVLDTSVRYAVISPQLSFYILRQLSQHVVNSNTSLFHEQEFTVPRRRAGHNNSGNGRDGRWLSTWVMRLAWGGGVWPDEVRSLHYSSDGRDDNEEGEEKCSSRKKHLRGKERGGNLYEKYGIHKYEETFNKAMGSGTCPSPKENQVSTNFLYLLNKAYDDVNRVCIDTETNMFVNFYMVNILKFICYKNYRHVLMNSCLFEQVDDRGGRSLLHYFLSFFCGGSAAEERSLERGDADRHLFSGGEQQQAGRFARRPFGSRHGSRRESASPPMNDVPPPKRLHKRDDRKEIAKQNANGNTHPHTYTQHQHGMDERMKILNDLYLVLYLRLLLECCVKIASIKKNLFMLEEKIKIEKGNKIFYLNTSDAIDNLKVHLLKRFRRGEEKRGLHIFFRPYGNAKGNAKTEELKYNPPQEKIIKKFPTWFSIDGEANYEQGSLCMWKNKLKGHAKKAKMYMHKKIFKLKKMINYYIINVDEAIKNKYYNRIHEKNVKRINEHLRENTQKEMDMKRFHDMYANMVSNLNGILSFAYAVDTRNQANRILSLYNTCVFYQYNYLNEHDSLFFKNGVSRYLRRLRDSSSSSSHKGEEDSTPEQPSFYYTNDIHLLLLLYTQRIQKCLHVFTYIYNKNHFHKYCSLCAVHQKLNSILFCNRRNSSHWVMNIAYLAYHNCFACFSFIYFFCVYSYVAFFLMYQSNTFSSVRYFGIFSDPGLSLYFVKLYTNARSLSSA